MLITVLCFLVPAVFINLLPADHKSHSVALACIYLPVLMWGVFGYVSSGFDLKNRIKRMDYIRLNGDLAVLSGLLIMGGALLVLILFILFHAININFERFFSEYLFFWILVTIPVVSLFLHRNFPNMTEKLVPVIAVVFSPLILVALLVYLILFPFSHIDLFNNREFLVAFNLMLIIVVAVIVFSASGNETILRRKFHEIILFLLVIISVVIDVIVLSALSYRIGEYGLSPNKLTALITNLLILGNLVVLLFNFFGVIFRKGEILKVEMTISRYLPIYLGWAVVVIFVFPFIFGYR